MKQWSVSRRRLLVGMTGVSGGLAKLRPTMAQSRRSDEESWESPDGSATMTWDPDLWEPAFPGSSDELSMALYDIEKKGGDGYFFNVEVIERDWATIDEAAASAMDEWFSQGMNGSVVAEEFQTDDAYGWLHYADFQDNPRTFSFFQFSQLEEQGGWLRIGLSIDSPAFDDDRMEDLLDAIRVNDERVPWVIDTDDLIDLIEDNERT